VLRDQIAPARLKVLEQEVDIFGAPQDRATIE
jgi:hypothetical protein